MAVPNGVVRVATLVFALGCGGDSTGPGDRVLAPGDRVPATGTYAYYFRATGGAAVEGKLVLTYATPDSIGGLIYAAYTKRKASPARWSGNSYLLDTEVGRHWITRRSSPTDLACKGEVILSVTARGYESEPRECRLTWESANTAPLVSATGDWSGESSLGALRLKLVTVGSAVSGTGDWVGKVRGGLGDPMSRRVNVDGGTVDGANLMLPLQGGPPGDFQLTGTMTAETIDARLSGVGFDNVRIVLSRID